MDWMKTDLFQSCDHCWIFKICWHIECSTFTASSFRIWNSSTGIPSPPLALFVMMLSKAYLTSHSRMSGCDYTIVIIWVVKIFIVQFFCVFLPPLLNLFCFFRSIPFLSFIKPIFAWNVPLVSLVFLKRSLVFPILLFSSISLHWLLRKVFLSVLILWDSPGKNTGVGCHFLLQGIFPTQGLNLHLLCFLYGRQILYLWATGETLHFNLKATFPKVKFSHSSICCFAINITNVESTT